MKLQKISIRKINKTKWLSFLVVSLAVSSIVFAAENDVKTKSVQGAKPAQTCEQAASKPCPLVKKSNRAPASLNDKASPQEQAIQAQRVQGMVNRHLIDTENAKLNERNHVLYQNRDALKSPKQAVKIYKMNPRAHDVDLDQEGMSEEMPQEQGYEIDRAYRPNAVVHSNIQSYQEEERYNQVYRKEFVKQFKRNLEAAGYKAVVDQNMVVRDIQVSN